MNTENKHKSTWLHLLEMLERALIPREPFRPFKYQALFYKVLPLVMALAITGIVAWRLSTTESLARAVGFSILIFVLVYLGGWIGVWVSRKAFVYDNSYTYQLLFNQYLFWIIVGIANFYTVISVLYHYRGLIGIILSIVPYLPSLVIVLLVTSRAMQYRPITPSSILSRVTVVSAFIITWIFFIWWILELSNNYFGALGIIIASILCICVSTLIFWRNSRQHS